MFGEHTLEAVLGLGHPLPPLEQRARQGPLGRKLDRPAQEGYGAGPLDLALALVKPDRQAAASLGQVRAIRRLIGAGPDAELEVTDGLLVVTSLQRENALVVSEYARVDLGRSSSGCLCLLYTSPSPRDVEESRMPSSA